MDKKIKRKKAIRIGINYYESWLVYFCVKFKIYRKKISMGIICKPQKNKKKKRKAIARLYTWLAHSKENAGYEFELRKR